MCRWKDLETCLNKCEIELRSGNPNLFSLLDIWHNCGFINDYDFRNFNIVYEFYKDRQKTKTDKIDIRLGMLASKYHLSPEQVQTIVYKRRVNV